jgi:hypothetical protein
LTETLTRQVEQHPDQRLARFCLHYRRIAGHQEECRNALEGLDAVFYPVKFRFAALSSRFRFVSKSPKANGISS